MILYTAVVLIGAARFIETTFNINYDVALLIFSIIVASYVIAGGLKGVMYTDALQGTIMFIGMLVLVIYTYSAVGGFVTGHKKLDTLMTKVEHQTTNESILKKTAAVMDKNKLDSKYAAEMLNTIKDISKKTGKKSKLSPKQKQLYTKNALKNIAAKYFDKEIEAVTKVYKAIAPLLAQKAYIAGSKKAGFTGWASMPKGGSIIWWILVSTIIMGVGIGVLAQPQLAVRFMTVKSTRELNRALTIGGIFILMMTGVAFIVGSLSNVFFFEKNGLLSLIVAHGNVDKIIPIYINAAMPLWFVYLFMIVLLSAAMSTNSSQFHAMGTALSRDILETLGVVNPEHSEKTMWITRIGISLIVIFTILVAYTLPAGFIARGTAIFFGLCAAAFLPAYIGALYFKGITKAGAISGIVTGFVVSLFWLLFVHIINSAKVGLVVALFGKPSLLVGSKWAFVDPILIALPISALVTIIVSLFTKKYEDEHLNKCFGE